MESVRAAVTARTRAIVVVNPNNPTGSFLKRNELDELATLAGRHGLVLIADEVFADFALADDSQRIATWRSWTVRRLCL